MAPGKRNTRHKKLRKISSRLPTHSRLLTKTVARALLFWRLGYRPQLSNARLRRCINEINVPLGMRVASNSCEKGNAYVCVTLPAATAPFERGTAPIFSPTSVSAHTGAEEPILSPTLPLLLLRALWRRGVGRSGRRGTRVLHHSLHGGGNLLYGSHCFRGNLGDRTSSLLRTLRHNLRGDLQSAFVEVHL